MTVYSKAAKRRAKKAKNVSDLREDWAKDALAAQSKEPDDPLATVRQARQRRMGRQGDFLAAIYCEEAGQVISIEAVGPDEAKRLWSVFARYDAADQAYCTRIIGKSRFPNVSKMDFLPERMETRADDRPDLRSEDEKIRDTVNTWARWQGHIGMLAAHERTAIRRAARQMDELHKGGRATIHGKAFVAALRVLRAMVDGNR